MLSPWGGVESVPTLGLTKKSTVEKRCLYSNELRSPSAFAISARLRGDTSSFAIFEKKVRRQKILDGLALRARANFAYACVKKSIVVCAMFVEA